MVFVFSPHIWKFTSCFQFQVNLTFNDFTAQNSPVSELVSCTFSTIPICPFFNSQNFYLYNIEVVLLYYTPSKYTETIETG